MPHCFPYAPARRTHALQGAEDDGFSTGVCSDMLVQKLFTPLKVGAVTTNNRIFMAAITSAFGRKC